MTLIVNCFTPDYVLQVSDRRLTYISGSRAGEVFDDEHNKAVFWNGYMAWAYTGITPLEGETTDVWLARTLLEANALAPDAALRHVQACAGRALGKVKRWRGALFPHTFSAVGYGHVSVGAGPDKRDHDGPFEVVISNTLDITRTWLPEPVERFNMFFYPYVQPPGTVSMSSYGQLPTHRELSEAWREITRMLKRSRDVMAVSQASQTLIRRVAGRAGTVGRNMMVGYIPRVAAERNVQEGRGGYSTGRLEADKCGFYYVSDHGQRVYAPHLVYGSQYMGPLDAPAGKSKGTIDGTKEWITISLALAKPPVERLYP